MTNPCTRDLSEAVSSVTSMVIVLAGSCRRSVSVTPGMAASTTLLALVMATLLTVKAASLACTALSAAESPEVPSRSASPKAMPVPPVRALVTVNALAAPVSRPVSTRR